MIQCWAEAEISRIFGEEAEGLKTRGYGWSHRNTAEAESGKDTCDDVRELLRRKGKCRCD